MMANDKKGQNPSLKTAAIGGGIIAILLLVVGAGLLIAVLAGLAIFAIGLLLLPRPSARAPEESHVVNAPVAPETQSATQPDTPNSAEALAEPEIETKTADVEAVKTVDDTQEPQGQTHTASKIIKASKVLPGQQELATRRGTWRFEGNARSA